MNNTIQFPNPLPKLENLKLNEIDIYNPSPELEQYIIRNSNLIAYYVPKFLTEDLSDDPDYDNLPAIDRHLILAFAFASLNLDTFEILNRKYQLEQ
jgi:hypothetical protein